MRTLSETYRDKIILLIFGKVNAGKSSFCNFFADAVGEADHKYFYVEKGKAIPSGRPFEEGVTECTSMIQGVELLDNLVLLDTPGLQCVTDENHVLTKFFTDSADAVIWLTSSHSPGQTQELNDLKEEIQRKKPFLPVITKSDFLEEDLDENDNFIKTFLVKSSEVRKAQEDDVKARSQELLSGLKLETKMKDPVSISVQYYKNHSPASSALEESGINRFFENLIPIIAEAHQYKRNKASKQIINYLEENVLRAIDSDIAPAIKELQATISEQKNNLQEKMQQISLDAIDEILTALPDLIDEYKDYKNTKGLSEAVAKTTISCVTKKVASELSTFVKDIDSALGKLPNINVGEFEEKYIEIQQVKGGTSQAISSALGGAGGAWAGAEAGAMIGAAFPPFGPLIGGTVGGILGALCGGTGGNAIGSAFVDTYTVKETIGVSVDEVTERTQKSIRNAVPKIVGPIITSCIEGVKPLNEYVIHINKSIDTFRKDVTAIKENLHE